MLLWTPSWYVPVYENILLIAIANMGVRNHIDPHYPHPKRRCRSFAREQRREGDRRASRVLGQRSQCHPQRGPHGPCEGRGSRAWRHHHRFRR